MGRDRLLHQLYHLNHVEFHYVFCFRCPLIIGSTLSKGLESLQGWFKSIFNACWTRSRSRECQSTYGKKEIYISKDTQNINFRFLEAIILCLRKFSWVGSKNLVPDPLVAPPSCVFFFLILVLLFCLICNFGPFILK